MLKRLPMLLLGYMFTITHQLPAARSDSPLSAVKYFDDHWFASSSSGKIDVDVREIQAEAIGPYEKAVLYRIFVMFEARSGAFLWRAQRDLSHEASKPQRLDTLKNASTLYLKDKHLISFTPGVGPIALYVQDLPARATSLNDAQSKALAAAATLNYPHGSLDSVQPLKTVLLTGLGLDFIYGEGNAVYGPLPKVTSLKWDGKYWIVTLEARWKEMITLNSSYDLISMRKIE